MIRNLVGEVEEIVSSTLASHVPASDNLAFSVTTFTETSFRVTDQGPQIQQTQCLGVWLVLDTDHERIDTQWSCSIADYREETLRSELVKVWDALVVQRMELDLKRV